MILQSMCVYDLKAKAYLPPFFVSNVEVGVRMVRSAMADSSHSFAKFPEDYVFYHLGSFDDETGRYQAFIENVIVCPLVKLVKGGV